MHRQIAAVGIAFFASVATFGATHNSPSAPATTLGDGGVSAFYIWDKKIPSKPGRLLRQEPLAASQMLANASQGVRILYTSTDGIRGKTPISVSGAIYLPKGQAPPKAGRSWHGRMAGSAECARIGSHAVRDGGNAYADCRHTAFGRAAGTCAEYGRRSRFQCGVVHRVRSAIPPRQFG